ncbi:LysR family transcriptional regulator (plasmid) [Aliisedimentitalea scapharcae]|uniref:HTH-type transcriptional regulator CbbR n=1 Tax=Aliisedimentitalea scapharcae TaxID=1524259 RepID=A0ABZ2XYZ7_9RHOB|nr:LysR family transcriptional regulator [Rhodobacteraceae bacterium M382]
MMDDKASALTVRQMQIFLSAMEKRSFVVAAQDLGLTPPAVSMQMSRLSETLGAPLFEKDGRSIQATTAALALVPYAERVLDTLHEAVEVVGSHQKKKNRLVRIAMVSTSRNFGPHLIQAFKQKHPDAKLEIAIANRQGVLEKLESGQADLALMGRTPRRFEVDAFAFSKHPYVLISHPDHPLSKFRKIRKSDLVPHRFIVREPGSGTRVVHDSYFQKSGLEPPRAQEMDSNANIKQAVMANMGLAFISAHTIDLEVQAGRVAILDAEGMPELREWFVLHLRGKPLGPAALTFKNFVIAEGNSFMRKFFATLPFPI